MINAGWAKDIGSKRVAVPQWNDSIAFEERVRKECSSSGFFDMSGG
jgi:hypothetical protein